MLLTDSSLFDNDWDKFREYHQQEDEREFLEIKEDQEKYRREKAQKIISDICQTHGVYDLEDIQRHPEVIDDIIETLKKISGLSLTKIAGFLGVSYSRVQRNRKY